MPLVHLFQTILLKKNSFHNFFFNSSSQSIISILIYQNCLIYQKCLIYHIWFIKFYVFKLIIILTLLLIISLIYVFKG